MMPNTYAKDVEIGGTISTDYEIVDKHHFTVSGHVSVVVRGKDGAPPFVVTYPENDYMREYEPPRATQVDVPSPGGAFTTTLSRHTSNGDDILSVAGGTMFRPMKTADVVDALRKLGVIK